MKTVIAAVVAFAFVACTRRGPNSSPAECEKPCAHVVDLRLAASRAAAGSRLHEVDEQLEATEDSANKTKAQIKQEMAGPAPYFNPKAFAHLPPKTQRELAERHAWEVSQLKVQRELALQRADAAVLDVKKKLEEMTAQAEADGKRDTSAALAECAAECTRRPRAFGECLQRTQAVEDIKVCQGP